APPRRATRRSTTPARPGRARPARASKPRRPRPPAATAPARSSAPPALVRQRRQLPEEERIPQTMFDDDRLVAAARTGREELKQLLGQHTEANPDLTAGDIDARW